MRISKAAHGRENRRKTVGLIGTLQALFGRKAQHLQPNETTGLQRLIRSAGKQISCESEELENNNSDFVNNAVNVPPNW